MTRDSGLNGAFTDHSTVADASVSAGVWPSGAPFTEDPTVEIPEIKITVNLADGEIHLRWRASPTANYTVRTSNSVAGPYTPVGNKLKFDDSSMYIFTDGITEIKDPGGNMLGAEGFQNYIKKYQEEPNNQRLRIMVEDIVKSGKIQKDDLTIVVIDSLK